VFGPGGGGESETSNKEFGVWGWGFWDVRSQSPESSLEKSMGCAGWKKSVLGALPLSTPPVHFALVILEMGVS
jgi:hypothetical protein